MKLPCCCQWPAEATHLSTISTASAETATTSVEARKDHSEDPNVGYCYFITIVWFTKDSEEWSLKSSEENELFLLFELFP